MKERETNISDIELEIEDRLWQHLPTDEIVDALVYQALDTWKRQEREIDKHLWDGRIDDNQGDQMRKQNTYLAGDYITAVHLWARKAK